MSVSIAVSGASEVNSTVCIFHSGYQLKAKTSNTAWVEAEGNSVLLDHSDVIAILRWWTAMTTVYTAERCSYCRKLLRSLSFLTSSSSLLMVRRSKLNSEVTP